MTTVITKRAAATVPRALGDMTDPLPAPPRTHAFDTDAARLIEALASIARRTSDAAVELTLLPQRASSRLDGGTWSARLRARVRATEEVHEGTIGLARDGARCLLTASLPPTHRLITRSSRPRAYLAAAGRVALATTLLALLVWTWAPLLEAPASPGLLVVLVESLEVALGAALLLEAARAVVTRSRAGVGYKVDARQRIPARQRLHHVIDALRRDPRLRPVTDAPDPARDRERLATRLLADRRDHAARETRAVVDADFAARFQRENAGVPTR